MRKALQTQPKGYSGRLQKTMSRREDPSEPKDKNIRQKIRTDRARSIDQPNRGLSVPPCQLEEVEMAN
jgi:hypothetical protein